MTTERTTCPKCDGKKIFSEYAGIAGGVCFTCNGAGTIILKKSRKMPLWLVSANDWNGKHFAGICRINAKNEAEALAKATKQIAGGIGYNPASVTVAAS